ncbi:MAG: trypsin-like peptidase domain-containing protein [Deltaproteobacteria bacterium]|nr:trypsin-like peptidase domain-containing protein [Deltaproteobacteria bacterium]
MAVVYGEPYRQAYPMPIAELDQVVTDWFKLQGFHVDRRPLEMGGIELFCRKGDESGCIVLSPRSALATQLRTTWAWGKGSNVSMLKELNLHIQAYLNGETQKTPPQPPKTGGPMVPPQVLSQIESVVCLKAALSEADTQFSGFIVDPHGLILTTAHGVKGLEEVTVVLYDGRQLKGTVIKIDHHRDLAFVDVDGTFSSYISVADGRNLLGIGEWLFTVGCPIDLRGTVYGGMVNGPPRRVHDQLLWQVDMEIHPGSSGSPVFDVEGNLVAVVKGRFRGTDTVGFLIPLETIVLFARDM